jgi:hypothetical protein
MGEVKCFYSLILLFVKRLGAKLNAVSRILFAWSNNFFTKRIVPKEANTEILYELFTLDEWFYIDYDARTKTKF